jgi:hypothetical protein
MIKRFRTPFVLLVDRAPNRGPARRRGYGLGPLIPVATPERDHARHLERGNDKPHIA